AFLPGSISFGTGPVVNIAQNAHLGVNLNGGRGSNTITVNYEGTITGSAGTVANPFNPAVGTAGTLSVVVNGGPAPDTLLTRILANTSSAGRGFASEAGRAGHDNLALPVYQQPLNGTPTTQVINVGAHIDGGPGHDHCDRTPNVSEVNCESHTLEPVFLPNGNFAPPFVPPGGVTQPGVPGAL